MEEALYNGEEDDRFEHEEVDGHYTNDQATKKAREDTAVVGAETSAADPAKRFKLKVLGMNKSCAQKDLDKAISAAGIQGVVKSKKVYKLGHGMIWFESEAARTTAIPAIQQFQFKKSGDITVELMDEDGEDSRDVRDDSKGPRKPRDAPVEDPNDTRTPQERINDQVTPLWRKSYEEQLDIKQKRFKNGMGNLKKNLLGFLNARDVATEKREDLKYVKELSRGETVCPLETVVPSPIIDDYRTKCEFTIGFDLDGQKSVGFLLGLFKDGVTTVLPPTECKNVPGAAKKVASMLQDFVQGSELPVYDRNSKEGFWRLVLVRTHTTGDVMVIVQINPVKQDAAVVTSEIEKLSQGFQASKNVTTLLIQESSGQFNGFQEGARTRVVFGEGVVHEELLGLRFRISPTAFFQVNTPATNGLYGRVREWCTNPAPYPGTEAVTEAAVPVDDASKNKNVVLLDLCCGTGTIGLTMAPNVKRVVGVEMVAEAVQDAQYNARLQGCSNVHYICSKVEDAMKEVFSKHVENGDEVVAVLDPPRSGVHGAVIQAVRACKGIKRVVFISCDFDAAMQNFVDLCRPTSKKFQGRPFRPVRAVPFDLFPHTSHCEFVMELQRKD